MENEDLKHGLYWVIWGGMFPDPRIETWQGSWRGHGNLAPSQIVCAVSTPEELLAQSAELAVLKSENVNLKESIRLCDWEASIPTRRHSDEAWIRRTESLEAALAASEEREREMREFVELVASDPCLKCGPTLRCLLIMDEGSDLACRSCRAGDILNQPTDDPCREHRHDIDGTCLAPAPTSGEKPDDSLTGCADDQTWGRMDSEKLREAVRKQLEPAAPSVTPEGE